MERNASAVRGTEFGKCDKYVLENIFGLILQNLNINTLSDPNKFVT
jgi:hypothetical protein